MNNIPNTERNSKEDLTEFSTISCTCQEHNCGKPMDIAFQPMPTSKADVIHNGVKGIAYATCWNEDCGLWGVTLAPAKHESLTETQRAEYRQSVRDMRAKIARMGA